MQFTRLNHFVQLATQTNELFVNGTAVGFDLRFTRTTHKAQTTPLTLKVGPCPYQSGSLIGQGSHFDLQHTFAGTCTIRENFEDQARTVEDLNTPVLFKVPLLNGTQVAIDQNEFDLFGFELLVQFLDLARAEQIPWLHFGQRYDRCAKDFQRWKGRRKCDSLV